MKSLGPFGKSLARWRKRAHVTQEKLAEKTSLSQNFICLLECGHREPSPMTVLRIQQALGLKRVIKIPYTFGHNLALLRIRARLSQGKLGKKAKLCSSFISLLERGCRQPSHKTLLRIQKALGVKLSALVPIDIRRKMLEDKSASRKPRPRPVGQFY